MPASQIRQTRFLPPPGAEHALAAAQGCQFVKAVPHANGQSRQRRSAEGGGLHLSGPVHRQPQQIRLDLHENIADWNVIIEHNDSGATPVKHPDKPRYTFAKSKDERGEDAYRFIGIFEWSETTPSGEHIYKRMASDMKLK